VDEIAAVEEDDDVEPVEAKEGGAVVPAMLLCTRGG
jgi:hypothetical protein